MTATPTSTDPGTDPSTREPGHAADTVERYAALSRSSARHGDLRLAALAAFAGDVHVLETLLWQNGLGEAPDPRAQLAAVGEAVAASIEAAAADATGELSDRAVVELARAAMVGTFDESVHDLLVGRLGGLDHLDPTDPTDPAPQGPASALRGVARLEGRTPAELVAELRTAAADCMVVAHVLATEGEYDAAVRLARQSDNAAFEACLVQSAIAAGDERLATVDLRWELAASVLDGPGAEDSEPRDLQARRDRLGALLGPAEREALHAGWAPVPPW